LKRGRGCVNSEAGGRFEASGIGQAGYLGTYISVAPGKSGGSPCE